MPFIRYHVTAAIAAFGLAASPALAQDAKPDVPKPTPEVSNRIQEAQDFFNQGENRVRDAKYREALESYNRAIQLNSTWGSPYVSRGAVRSKLGDYQGAIQDLDRAAQINPTDALILRASGQCAF